jgi:hypothetical protein
MGGVAATFCAWLSGVIASASAAHHHMPLMMDLLYRGNNFCREFVEPGFLAYPVAGCQRSP